LFCRYISGCNILHSTIYKSFILTGKTSNKQSVLDDYNTACKDGGAILICSDVGGESINLPLTKYIINVDVPWGDADFIQRSSRGRRADSEHSTCFVFQLVVPGFDEYKLNLCKWKGVFSDFVIDGVANNSNRPDFRAYLNNDDFIGEYNG
jgi:predicted outer membrane repeat protein